MVNALSKLELVSSCTSNDRESIATKRIGEISVICALISGDDDLSELVKDWILEKMNEIKSDYSSMQSSILPASNSTASVNYILPEGCKMVNSDLDDSTKIVT